MKNTTIRIAFALLTVVSVASCAQKTDSSIQGSGPVVLTLTVAEFNDKLNNTAEKQIVDVRTPEEFNTGHLQNAVNIDIYNNNFDKEIANLDKNKTVFVYCKSGGRSADAAAKMKGMGFSVVYDMKGGMMAWTKNNLPTEKHQSTVADKFTFTDYEKLLAAETPVLIDYYAPWCGPCIKMEPSLTKLASEYQGKVQIVRINVDEATALAKQLAIENIPVLTSHKKGGQVGKVIGYQSEEQLRVMIEELLK